jgi:poly(3-hydroxybutyrate) depolymerase
MSSTVTRYAYGGGDERAAVLNYVIANGGHAEPSVQEQYNDAGAYQKVAGAQNNDIELTHELWKFFVTQTRRGKGKFDLAFFRTLLWQLEPEFAHVLPEEWGVR